MSAKTNYNIREVFASAAEEYVSQAYGNEVTIGNIENIHNGYVAKMGDPICLDEKPVVGPKVGKKKAGCC